MAQSLIDLPGCYRSFVLRTGIRDFFAGMNSFLFGTPDGCRQCRPCKASRIRPDGIQSFFWVTL
jgi:hypothetical protein